MTDLTTRTAGTDGVPPPARSDVAANARALRHTLRAEQERLNADAEVDRQARAGRLELELRDQRREADRRERQAKAAEKQDHLERRRARRTARRGRLRAAAPRWADRALFILPILFPMAVAWAGQIQFAMTVMHWPLAAAIVFAAGFELSTAYVARLDWLARAAGDNALLFRAFTWAFASGAATMNYWHAAGPGLTPTGEAVSYGFMSITGVVLWELWSIHRHRTALRQQGKLPAARPRFGLARWIWFPSLTYLAWLIVVRDGQPTTDIAWRSAIAAIERYRSPRAARKAIRSGRPVQHPAPGAPGTAVTLDRVGQRLDGRESSRSNDGRDTLRSNGVLRPEGAGAGTIASPSGHHGPSPATMPAHPANAWQSAGSDHHTSEAATNVDHQPLTVRAELALHNANGAATDRAFSDDQYAAPQVERTSLSQSNGRPSQPDGRSNAVQPATHQPSGSARATSEPTGTDPRIVTSAEPEIDGTDAAATDGHQSGRAHATVAAIKRDAEPARLPVRTTADRTDDLPLYDRNWRHGEQPQAIERQSQKRATAERDTTGRESAGHELAEPIGSEPDRQLDGERGNGTVRARMTAYARARIAEGVLLTGAELDREFGTSDYGRKVLRQLAAASNGGR